MSPKGSTQIIRCLQRGPYRSSCDSKGSIQIIRCLQRGPYRSSCDSKGVHTNQHATPKGTIQIIRHLQRGPYRSSGISKGVHTDHHATPKGSIQIIMRLQRGPYRSSGVSESSVSSDTLLEHECCKYIPRGRRSATPRDHKRVVSTSAAKGESESIEVSSTNASVTSRSTPIPSLVNKQMSRHFTFDVQLHHARKFIFFMQLQQIYFPCFLLFSKLPCSCAASSLTGFNA